MGLYTGWDHRGVDGLKKSLKETGWKMAQLVSIPVEVEQKTTGTISWSVHKRVNVIQFNVSDEYLEISAATVVFVVLLLTSETPTPCYREDTPAWFLASGRCSGSGTHAEEGT